MCFVYNEHSFRVQKTVNGVVTKYTLSGKNVVRMTQGSNELHFFYDAQNKPAVVVYNGVPYSYVKNLQGDIVAILDSNNNVVVSYVYDAWGRPISKTGGMASTLGTVQPFRYRGYVYDEETRLYYLRSRYYNSILSRFAESDGILAVDGTLKTRNSYSYCENAVIDRADPDGFIDELTSPLHLAKYKMPQGSGTYDGDSGGSAIPLAITSLIIWIQTLASTIGSKSEVKETNRRQKTSYSYWEAELVQVGGHKRVCVYGPLTFEEACFRVSQLKSVVCKDEASAIAIIRANGYYNAAGPENHGEGDQTYLSHYHPTRNHTGYDSVHIWFYK